MYRLTLKNDYNHSDHDSVQAVPLTQSILMNLIKNKDEEEKMLIWTKIKEEIKEGRKFVIIKEDRIVSSAKISDVDFSGGNIVVYTDFQYRKLGHGKQVVKKSIDWCLEKHILPIYLVDIENRPSVSLAESLGFEIMSKEVIVSITL